MAHSYTTLCSFHLYLYLCSSLVTMATLPDYPENCLNKKLNQDTEKLRDLTKAARCLGGAAATAAKSLQSCLTLCDPIDGSPPGSPVPGILQARTLEWVAIAFSKDNTRRLIK